MAQSIPCAAFHRAMDVLGRPWTALILQSLRSGPRRFGEIATAAQGMSDKMLSARLKELEGRGLVLRHVEAGPPVRVSYELTERGHAFGEVAEAIRKWGECLAEAPELTQAEEGACSAKPGATSEAPRARARSRAR